MKKYICILKIADTSFKVVFNFGSLTFVTYLSHSLTYYYLVLPWVWNFSTWLWALSGKKEHGQLYLTCPNRLTISREVEDMLFDIVEE